jgi:HD superfamily phosphohydrolase YqeK
VTIPPLAHSKNGFGFTHLLQQHSEAVAKLAEDFAALFDSSGFARCAGLWHDLGKNADDFQKRLAAVDDTHSLKPATTSVSNSRDEEWQGLSGVCQGFPP